LALLTMASQHPQELLMLTSERSQMMRNPLSFCVRCVVLMQFALFASACGVNAPDDPYVPALGQPTGIADMGFVPPKPIGDTDAGTNVGDPCNLWANIPDDRLLATLHEELQQAYRSLQPEPDLGGNLNRYTTARKAMFTEVERYRDSDGTYVVECVYTATQAEAPQTQDPDNDIINCEHVMPRARMVDKNAMATLYSHQQSDIHNLMPATPGSNSTRGSQPYGEVVRERNLDHMPSILGENRTGALVWQPRAERRGDLARIVFYMSIRWGIDIGAEEEAVLRNWNRSDPPDTRETIRNQAIADIQGNRNPLIDCPSLADRITDFIAFQGIDTDATLPSP
jgi:endonuclease I